MYTFKSPINLCKSKLYITHRKSLANDSCVYESCPTQTKWLTKHLISYIYHRYTSITDTSTIVYTYRIAFKRSQYLLRNSRHSSAHSVEPFRIYMCFPQTAISRAHRNYLKRGPRCFLPCVYPREFHIWIGGMNRGACTGAGMARGYNVIGNLGPSLSLSLSLSCTYLPDGQYWNTIELEGDAGRSRDSDCYKRARGRRWRKWRDGWKVWIGLSLPRPRAKYRRQLAIQARRVKSTPTSRRWHTHTRECILTMARAPGVII